MNICTLTGNIGRDAELRNTPNGKQVASFQLAVDEGWGDRKTTIWVDCSLWGDRAAKVAPIITKGKPATVSGAVGVREYNGKAIMTMNVREIEVHGGRSGGDRREEQPAQGDLDDEIPF